MTRPPQEAYIDEACFLREQTELFASAWVFAGTTMDFKKPGDYLTARAGAFPLAVLRLEDSSLTAVHNICRHRGTQLLDEKSGNAGKSIVCPYHRWTYGLDGSLRGAPDMAACFGALDRARLSLKPAAIGVLNNLVFINPDPAADFADWMQPLEGLGWPHDLTAPDLREGAALQYELKCDWKVFVENALDGYHLAYLHEHTLGGPKPDSNLWQRAGDHLIWYATDEGVPHRLPGKVRREAHGARKVKSEQPEGYGGVYYLFPTTLIIPTPYNFSISTLQPDAAGKCTIHVRHWVGPGQARDERKYIPGYDKKTGVISSDHWTRHPLETGDFQTEDIWICEKVQRGLASPAYEHGPLATGPGAEDAISWFHEMLGKAY